MSGLRSKILTLAVVGAIVGFIVWEWPAFSAIELVHPVGLLLGFIGHMGSFVFSAAVNLVLMRRLGSKITYPQVFHIGVGTTFTNLLLPFRGGLAARAIYLKKMFDFSYADFLLSTFGFYVISILISSLTATCALTYLWLTAQEAESLLTVLISVSAACLFGVLCLAVVPRIPAKGGPLLQKVAKVIEGWHRLRSDHLSTMRLVAIGLAEYFSSFVMLWGCYYALGISFEPINLIIVTSLSNIAFFVSITPGALGVYESVIAYVAQLGHVAPTTSVAVTLVSRVILLSALCLLGPIASRKLTLDAKIPREEPS